MENKVRCDCFAYNISNKSCTALKELYCKKEKCSFYQDKEHMNRAHIESAIRNYSRYHN